MVCLWVFARVLVLRWQAGGVCLVVELLSCKCEAGCCVSDLCLHRVAGVSVLLPPPVCSPIPGVVGLWGPMGSVSAFVPCVLWMCECLPGGVCQTVSLGFSALCLAAGSVYSRL